MMVSGKMVDDTVVNVNIGILGHVDSGKTSLAKALSSTASTAAFDKSPESQRRGITLDLGFSACMVDTATMAPTLHAAGIPQVQCTFVDCPGHASLIKTILGGAQIIDIMILVVDACKGIQTQTAECIVIGEVLQRPLVVAINKIDALQESTEGDKRAALEKLRKRLGKTFERTRWPNVPMVEVAAAPRGDAEPIHTRALLSAAMQLLDAPRLAAQRTEPLRTEDFVMMVDHCFALKGQGTVFTGTVLRGAVRVGDDILIPEARVVKKVKGLQVFRRPVSCARRGDRVGICVTQFDAAEMERGLLCSAREAPGCGVAVFESASVLIAEVSRVRFHQLPCDAHTRFHVTIGHTTVMGTMKYFSRPTPSVFGADAAFDLAAESRHVESLEADAALTFDVRAERPPGQPAPLRRGWRTYYAVVLLERPVMAAVGTPLIAARLDAERENMCRIAIAGTVRAILPAPAASRAEGLWRSLPIVRLKTRALEVERVLNDRSCIARGVVSADAGGGGKVKEKDTLHAEVQKFIGLRVRFRPTSSEGTTDVVADEEDHEALIGAVEGVIDSAFGKTGKVKLVFGKPVFATDVGDGEKRKKGDVAFLTDGVVELTLKKYPHAVQSHLQQ